MIAEAAQRAVEMAARNSYGRLVAYLALRCRDVAAAEDALGDAFRAALETWPRDGVPQNPEAWLLTAARRRLIDESRRAAVRVDALPELVADAEARAMRSENERFPDERLKLLFVCAHPAIDAASRTPLMLQTVLGLDAARIASAFLVKPSAMGQRLSRAKTKIAKAGIAFAVPEAKELPSRLDAVLEAIYAAYGSGWEDVAGADRRRRGLSVEALHLGRVLLELLPGEPEAEGLVALMLYCESRKAARRDAQGRYVPLSEQDVTRWSQPMIDDADALLRTAERRGRLGRFQLEAAIQHMHARRARGAAVDWESIALLYEGLVRFAPTIGAHIGRAAAIAEARGAEAGWSLLEAMPHDAVATYQPYWALAAHLLTRLGRTSEAARAYDRAIGLCDDEAMREFLRAKR